MTGTTMNDISGITNKAFPHNNTGNARYWHTNSFAGAGGLKSNLRDLIKYTRAQLSTDSSTALSRAILLSQQATAQLNGKDVFGLGWGYYYTPANKRVLMKDGGTGGFTSFIVLDKSAQKAVVALFNNNEDNDPATPLANFIHSYFN